MFLRKSSRQIRHISQAGFTLMELMIAVTLTSFITLAISSVFIFSIEQLNILMNQHKAEENMLFASYHIRSFLSQAVNTQVTSANSCNVNSFNQDQGTIVNTNGNVMSYNTNTGCCASPATHLLALFPRENSFKFNTVDLFETSIFYECPTPPTATAPSHPGRLIFGLGKRTNRDTNYWHSPSSPNNIIYTGLSDFEITTDSKTAKTYNDAHNPTKYEDTNMVRKATVSLTFRYFLYTTDDSYDYFSPIGNLNAREMKSTIEINFHNNTMGNCDNSLVGCFRTTGTEKERIFGPIYFYKMVLPAGIFSF